MTSLVKRSRTTRAAVAPISAARCGSWSRSSIAVTRACSSPGGTSTPVTPVLDVVVQPGVAGGDDRSPAGHRLEDHGQPGPGDGRAHRQRHDRRPPVHRSDPAVEALGVPHAEVVGHVTPAWPSPARGYAPAAASADLEHGPDRAGRGRGSGPRPRTRSRPDAPAGAGRRRSRCRCRTAGTAPGPAPRPIASTAGPASGRTGTTRARRPATPVARAPPAPGSSRPAWSASRRPPRPVAAAGPGAAGRRAPTVRSS